MPMPPPWLCNVLTAVHVNQPSALHDEQVAEALPSFLRLTAFTLVSSGSVQMEVEEEEDGETGNNQPPPVGAASAFAADPASAASLLTKCLLAVRDTKLPATSRRTLLAWMASSLPSGGQGLRSFCFLDTASSGGLDVV
jgi:hypothetical protein